VFSTASSVCSSKERTKPVSRFPALIGKCGRDRFPGSAHFHTHKISAERRNHVRVPFGAAWRKQRRTPKPKLRIHFHFALVDEAFFVRRCRNSIWVFNRKNVAPDAVEFILFEPSAASGLIYGAGSRAGTRSKLFPSSFLRKLCSVTGLVGR